MSEPYSQTVLCHAALSFVAAEAGKRNPRLGQAIGLSDQQVLEIKALPADALMKMAMMSAGCVQVCFDREAVDALLADVSATVQQERLIDELIRHDASRDMMAVLFSMTYRDYARARQSLGVTLTTGRIRELTPAEADRVFTSWQALGGRYDAASYLAIAKDLDLPLRLIWEELTKNYPGEHHTADGRAGHGQTTGKRPFGHGQLSEG